MMKKTGGLILLLFICLILAACSSDDNKSSSGTPSAASSSGLESTSTPAPQTAKIVEINDIEGTLNIRDAASTDGEVLAEAEAGDRFRLLVDEKDNGWYQIQYGTGKAYVHGDYVTVKEVTVDEANKLGSSSSSSESSASSSESSASESSTSASSSETGSSNKITEDGQA